MEDEFNIVTGTESNDGLLAGSTGNDIVNGLGGDDALNETTGNDTYDGGEGVDQIDYNLTPDDYTFSRNEDGSVNVVKPNGDVDTLINVEGVLFLNDGDITQNTTYIAMETLAPFAEEITPATENADTISGTSDDDFIDALGGDDIINGSDGTDAINGGEGSDMVSYAGTPADYTFVRNGDESITVTKPDGGVDTLTSVENFWFNGSDQWFAAQTLAPVEVSPATDQADEITGSSVADTINALAGDDTIIASSGNDVIDGGEGSDTIVYEGAAADYTFVRNADETISVTKIDGSIDILTSVEGVWFSGAEEWVSTNDLAPLVVTTATEGEDTITGTSGDDVIDTLGGPDFVNGSAGNDTINGGDGADMMIYDGAAADYTIVRNEDDTLSVTKPDGGVDTLTSVESFWFNGEQEWYAAETLAPLPATPATEASDDLAGTDDADIINALGGDDTISGSQGSDTIDGGEGADMVVYDGAAADYVFVRNEDESITVTKADGSVDTLISVESFWFSGAEEWAAAETLAPSTLIAPTTEGNDDISGTVADDVIDTLGGDDTITGSEGSDAINGGEGADMVVYEGAAADYVLVRNEDESITVTKPDGGVDTLTSVESFWFNGSQEWFAAQTLAPVELAEATAGDDEITGTSTDDNIASLAGDDTINASSGNDVIDGGEGSDTVVYTGAAADYTFVRNANETISVTKPDGSIDTLTSVEGIWFNGAAEWAATADLAPLVVTPATEGEDTISGTSGDDVIDTLGGPDFINGSDGNDTINGGEGEDQMIYEGAAADYTIVRNADETISVTKPDGDVDTLTSIESFWFIGSEQWFDAQVLAPIVVTEATAGNDEITGTSIADVINTLAGDDTIIASTGNDVIDGGEGSDTIVYEGAAADYSFVRNADESISVTKTDGSVDTLTSVEGVWFNGAEEWASTADLAPLAVAPGTAGEDTITGTSGDDIIDALAGSDSINGSAGNDTIDGGDGDDIMIYDGDFADYTVTGNADGTITVAKPDGFADQLTSIESFWFNGDQQWFAANSFAADEEVPVVAEIDLGLVDVAG